MSAFCPHQSTLLGVGQSFLILFNDGSHLAVARVPAATTVLTETEKDRRLAQLGT